MFRRRRIDSGVACAQSWLEAYAAIPVYNVNRDQAILKASRLAERHVNWKDWLKEVSTKFTAGVAVLVFGWIAVSIWPPLKLWTIGHQNLAYAFLALIVGIVIGYFFNTLRKPPGEFRSNRVANLFWLGSDLQSARQWANRGDRDKVVRNLKQAFHHTSELGLINTPSGQQLLAHKTAVEGMPPQLGDAEKGRVAAQIDSDLTSFSDLMRRYQPDVRFFP
jgi:uncharacterized membrane protein YraQ (UPF0718 family)